MALTYNAYLHKRSIGADYLLTASITPGSSDYATKGYALDKTFGGAFPLGVIKSLIFAGVNMSSEPTTMILPVYNYSTSKLMMIWGVGSAAAFAEVTNGTDLSAFTFVLDVVGK